MDIKATVRKILAKNEWRKEIVEIKPDKCKIVIVDGNYVRNNFDIEFALGGHHWRYDAISPNEIWVEPTTSYNDLSENVVHEIIERIYMKNLGIDYETAHSYASSIEHAIRLINDGKFNCTNTTVSKFSFMHQ